MVHQGWRQLCICCITPAMQYGLGNEPVAHEAYIAKQREHNRTVFVSKELLLLCVLH